MAAESASDLSLLASSSSLCFSALLFLIVSCCRGILALRSVILCSHSPLNYSERSVRPRLTHLLSAAVDMPVVTFDSVQAPLPFLFELVRMLGGVLRLLVVKFLLALLGPGRVLLDLSLPPLLGSFIFLLFSLLNFSVNNLFCSQVHNVALL